MGRPASMKPAGRGKPHIKEEGRTRQTSGHGDGTTELLYAFLGECLQVVGRECTMSDGNTGSTREGQLVGMNLTLHAIFLASLEEAVGLLWREETLVAEHVHKVGQSLGSHTGHHLVDDEIDIF